MSKLYLTTAIPYMNGTPHIGHALDYLLGDIYARYQRLSGNEVRFQAGTDEHGNKIQQKAESLGISTQELVDQNAAAFKQFIKSMGVHYTDFIRTTDSKHVRLVQEIWRRLSPHIYPSFYDGWYCEGCENYVSEKEYTEHDGVCPDHQKQYKRLKEKNYYFRLSDFKERVRGAIEAGEMKILPEYRAKEILKMLDNSPDVSISRPISQLTWGVPVPDDKEQVMYVWVDALSNYLTVLDYPEKELGENWPPAVQLVGKDILRFHAIIWPAMLIALGLELPKVILSHGFVLSQGQKMSKSLGNIVDPVEVLGRHGVDGFRYYFTRHIDTFNDSDFSDEKFEGAYNNELANDYGNLVQRLAALCRKNEMGGVKFQAEKDETYTELMDNFRFSEGINYAWGLLQKLNKRIDETKPWAVVKDEEEAGKQLLESLVGDLLAANHLLKPFLPVAEQVEQIFTSREIVPPSEPLFPKTQK